MACKQLKFRSNKGVRFDKLRAGFGLLSRHGDLVAQDDSAAVASLEDIILSYTFPPAHSESSIRARLARLGDPVVTAGSREAHMMPKINRLTGRFLTVLISLSVAVLLPRAVVAGEATPPRPPLASSAATGVVPGERADRPAPNPYIKDATAALSKSGRLFAEWPAQRRFTPLRLQPGAPTLLARVASLPNRTSPANLLAAPAGGVAKSGPTLCQISDTVYRADGSPAQGTVLLSWQAFTTAAGQAVTPGSLLVTLDANGGFNASVAPNTGASPVGTYYKAIFKLNDGTTETEYWVVPNIQSTTIGAIRSKLVPSNQAAQFLTRDVAESNYLNLTTNESVAGVKTFSSSPTVPTPQNSTDAANKAYVDANAGGNLGAPPPIGNVTPNTVNATALTAQNVNGVLNAAAYPGADWSVATNAAIAAAPAGATIDMRGFSAAQLAIAGSATITESKNQHIVWPSGVLVLNGCPGIKVTTTGELVNEGQGWLYSYTPSGVNGTELVSGSACPLIQDLSSIGHQILNLSLNGNHVGTVGILSQANGGSGDLIRDIHIHHFLYAGAILPGTGSFDGRFMINDNGGDGLLLGSAWTVNGGDAEIVANGGNGIHNIGEGPFFTAPNVDRSGLNGLYFDGRIPQPWAASTTYVSPSLLKPAPSPHNAGNFYFYSENVNCRTGSGAEPTWPQTIGSTITDGTCIWVNISALNGGLQPNVGEAQGIGLSNPQIIRSGNTPIAGYTPSNIRLEGAASNNPTCGAYDVLSGVLVSMGMSASTNNPNGLHLLNCAGVVVDGYTYAGNSSSNGATSADGYGLVVENSYDILVNNYYAYWSTKSPLKIINTNSSQVTGMGALCWSNSSVTGNDAYAVQIDGASSTIQITNLLLDTACGRANAKGVFNAGSLISLDNYQLHPNSVLGTLDTLGTATLTNAHGRTSNVPVEFDIAGNPALSIDGNAKVTVANALTFQSIPGVEFLVSKYASIQAAINAAYNNGAVLGTVVDDRTAPYSGPGFILYDSVTLKLAPTTYTIASTVTYNNGNNNVTAGIIAVPGAKLIGASTSTNHGTIITAGNGLNADLIATSTVGTGAGSAAQWWHWGGFENLRVTGNGANQTTGNCFNIENMGETAFLRTIEVSGCKVDNILFTGASATPSDIANITTNSAGRYGFNFNNLSGVAVVHGLSGDSNATSIVRLNGGQSGTLTILGFKTEEEISGQDPLITIDQTGQGAAQPSLFIVGGYTFGRSGVTDVIKYVNGTVGTTPYISVSNFYVQDYANAVNDVVNSRTTAATNMNKVPFYYGPTGAFFSGQAFTLDLNTFVQSPHSGNYTLTEVFGTTSSNETLVAASGTSTSLSTGGIGFRMANRSVYGQTPELFAKMTYAFPGGVPNTQQWEFIPAKVGGDNSTRWIGDPSYRWDEIYSADVNTTTATVGTLNVTTCVGCGAHLVGGSMQGNTSRSPATAPTRLSIPQRCRPEHFRRARERAAKRSGNTPSTAARPSPINGRWAARPQPTPDLPAPAPTW